MKAAGSALVACAAAARITGCTTTPPLTTPRRSQAPPHPLPHLPRHRTARCRHRRAPAHTLVVMLENHSCGQVIGNPSAPFLNKLARGGALFTNARAITHPSEPNYLALFSGRDAHYQRVAMRGPQDPW